MSSAPRCSTRVSLAALTVHYLLFHPLHFYSRFFISAFAFVFLGSLRFASLATAHRPLCSPLEVAQGLVIIFFFILVTYFFFVAFGSGVVQTPQGLELRRLCFAFDSVAVGLSIFRSSFSSFILLQLRRRKACATGAS